MIKHIFSLIIVMFALSACQSSTNDAGGIGDGRLSDGTILPGTQADLQSNIGDRVFFLLDSSVLSAEAKATLQKQSDWLKQYQNVSLVIEGHCDERGTEEYNMGLGDRRANAAKKYLVSLGIDASRLSVESFGKTRPAVIGTGEEVWSQNRRSVSVVVQSSK